MSQLFKKKVPNEVLFELLDEIAIQPVAAAAAHKAGFKCTHVINYYTYRKMIFHNKHVAFLEQVLLHYKSSKQFYVTRQLSYNSFVNIVRQICKHNKILFCNKIHYNQSDYNIVFYVIKPVAEILPADLLLLPLSPEHLPFDAQSIESLAAEANDQLESTHLETKE